MPPVSRFPPLFRRPGPCRLLHGPIGSRQISVDLSCRSLDEAHCDGPAPSPDIVETPCHHPTGFLLRCADGRRDAAATRSSRATARTGRGCSRRPAPTAATTRPPSTSRRSRPWCRANAASWVAVLARPDVRGAPGAGRVVAARVRLPRARRVPPVRHPPAPDARRGRPAVRQLGPGRDGDRRPLLGAGPGHRRRRPGHGRRRGRGVVRRRRGRRSGSALAAAAMAPGSPSSRSGATSSTTGCTTPGTSARPDQARRAPDAPKPGVRPNSRPHACQLISDAAHTSDVLPLRLRSSAAVRDVRIRETPCFWRSRSLATCRNRSTPPSSGRSPPTSGRSRRSAARAS